MDTGQEIFQRKFKADLEQFMRPGEPAIRTIDASKSGKVTLSGELRENRERNTERIFNSLLSMSFAILYLYFWPSLSFPAL